MVKIVISVFIILLNFSQLFIYAILYKKFKNLQKENICLQKENTKLKSEITARINKEWSELGELDFFKKRIIQLNAEIEEWKAKYLDVLEQNLRLAERITVLLGGADNG
jgi:chromosome segregation ATPase